MKNELPAGIGTIVVPGLLYSDMRRGRAPILSSSSKYTFHIDEISKIRMQNKKLKKILNIMNIVKLCVLCMFVF